MKLNINESKINRNKPITKISAKSKLTESLGNYTQDIKVCIGSWGSYNSNNERALGSKWIDLSDFSDWYEIEDELTAQGFDLEGIDEELFIQDIDGIDGIGEHENPQSVIETIYESDILFDSNMGPVFDAFMEVSDWSEFKRLVDENGSNWADEIYIYPDYDWDDLGREVFEQIYPELMEYDVIDNYFDFAEYGESLQYEGNYERFSKGIIELPY